MAEGPASCSPASWLSASPGPSATNRARRHGRDGRRHVERRDPDRHVEHTAGDRAEDAGQAAGAAAHALDRALMVRRAAARQHHEVGRPHQPVPHADDEAGIRQRQTIAGAGDWAQTRMKPKLSAPARKFRYL
jgi:hypothetical protein